MHSRWTIPVFSVVLGLVMLGAFAKGNQLASGFWSLGVMLLFGTVVLLGGRSETVRGLRGDGRDERFAMLDLQATALAGLAVTVSVIIAFVLSVASGHNGEPYEWLGAVAGLGYIAAIIVLRIRG